MTTENNGLCTSTWGSPGWFFLHSVAAGYPLNPDKFDADENKPIGTTRRTYTTFFNSIGGILPCRFCRDSYMVFIKEVPIEDYIHSRESLFEWVFLIHNKVNDKLGVKQTPKLKDIVDKYESFRARCPKSKKAKGCTDPAGNYIKMKCSVLVEPFDGCSRVPIVISLVAITLLFLLQLKKK